MIEGDKARVSTHCGGRVRRCFAISRDHLRITLWVYLAASPWRSFFLDIVSLRCVSLGSSGRNTLSMEGGYW